MQAAQYKIYSVLNILGKKSSFTFCFLCHKEHVSKIDKETCMKILLITTFTSVNYTGGVL